VIGLFEADHHQVWHWAVLMPIVGQYWAGIAGSQTLTLSSAVMAVGQNQQRQCRLVLKPRVSGLHVMTACSGRWLVAGAATSVVRDIIAGAIICRQLW